MTDLNAPPSHQPETACDTPAPGLIAWILAALESRIHACRPRRDAHHLASLSDYLLKDMGITRNHIDVVVRRGRHSV